MIVFKQYSAIAELCTKTIFIGDILKFLGLRIRRTTAIFGDNAGTIFLSLNTKSGARKKHIDVMSNTISSEYVVDGLFLCTQKRMMQMCSPRLVGTHLKNNNENHVHNSTY